MKYLFSRFIILFVLFSIGNTTTAQDSYNDLIANIRTNHFDQETQIYLFHKLLRSKQNDEIPTDTLALIHYYLSFRYYNINDLEQSKDHAEQAVQYFQDSHYQGYQLPGIIGKLGDIYYTNKQFDKALSTYARLDSFDITGRGYNALLNAKRISAVIYRSRDDQESEVRFLDYCKTFIDSCSVQDQSAFYLDLSISYSNYGEQYFDQSKKALEKSIRLNFDQDSKYYLSEVRHAHQLNQKAFLALAEDNVSQASQLYDEAIKFSMSNLDAEDSAARARAMANLAYTILENKQPELALKWIQQSEKAFDKFGDSQHELDEGFIYNMSSEIHLALQNFELSNNYADKLLTLFDMIDYPNSRSKYFLIEALHKKITGLYLLDKNEGKQNHSDTILKLIDDFHLVMDLYLQKTLFEESAIFIKEKTNKYYATLIELAFEYSNENLFWEISEKTKSLLLLDAVKTAGKLEPQTSDSLRINRENQIALSYQLEYDQLSQTQKDSVQRSLVFHKNKELEIQSQLKKKKQMLKAKLPTIALDEIVNQLDTQTLVQYQFGNQHLYAIKIENKKSNVYKLGSRDSITHLISLFTKHLNIPSQSTQDLSNLHTTSFNLFTKLIKPLDLNNQDIIIIPDGALNFIPFEALQESNTINQPNYLLESYNFQYQNSGSLYTTHTDVNKQDNQLILFNPEYNSVHKTNDQLTSLYFSKEETQAIKNETNATLKKTKVDFLKELSDGHNIHFSGHAIVNTLDNRWSHLAFSAGDDLTDKITLQELYNRKSNSDLVFMSACNTGTGNIIQGEGISSLTRGFLYAGVKAVVSSLWSVDDQSTSQIASSFYTYLNEGYHKSQALRKAKLNYLKEAADDLKHPYYWSSLISIGNDTPIQLKQQTKWSFLLSGLGLTILGVLAMLWYRKSNNR